MTAEAPLEDFPLRQGSAEDFARVESLLRSAGFDEPTLCGVLKIGAISMLGCVKPEEVDFDQMESKTLPSLIRLFLFLQSVDAEDVSRAIEPAALKALVSLDLLRVGCFNFGEEGAKEKYVSTVLLYPVAGLLIASDRHKTPEGADITVPADAVFPAIFAGTLRFLQIISKSPAQNALDLCSGTGVAALALSRSAVRVVASDITARSAHFARFNRLLNRCYNVEVAQGDLYDSLGDRKFDRIVAHPPYVPALSSPQVFRDGGETGETIVRRIIEGLPEYLEPGGTFYCVCGGWDGIVEPFEQRARNWLGASHAQFDIIFAHYNDMSPERLAKQLAEREQSSDPLPVSHWDDLFSKAGMKRFIYGAIAIRRRKPVDCGAAEDEPLTLRLRLGQSTDGECFEWAFNWHRWRARRETAGDLHRAVSQLRPRLGAHMQLRVTYAVEEGELVAGDAVIESQWPFLAETRIIMMMMPVIANFDGNRTVAEVYQAGRDKEIVPNSVCPADFTMLIANMIERGYLETELEMSDSE